MEWWSIVKYRISSTTSQGFRCRVSGVRKENKKLKPETFSTGKAIELCPGLTDQVFDVE
jgi:hypothetical protein